MASSILFFSTSINVIPAVVTGNVASTAIGFTGSFELELSAPSSDLMPACFFGPAIVGLAGLFILLLYLEFFDWLLVSRKSSSVFQN